MQPPAMPRKPIVGVLGQNEWLTRSLASILTSNGYLTQSIVDPQLDPRRLDDWLPDVVILEADLPDTIMKQALRSLQGMAWFGPCTPVFGVTAEPLNRERRLESVKAGIWDVFSHPIDAESLVLKVSLFASAKLEADARAERGLTDPDTDLYNVRGVLRRIYEAASEADRLERPLACIAAALDPPTGVGLPLEPHRARDLADRLRKNCRASDVFGRVGANEFVVIAPGTDSTGAKSFAERLAGNIRPLEGDPEAELRAGYAAVADVRAASVEPVDLYTRALSALRAAQSAGGDELVRAWE